MARAIAPGIRRGCAGGPQAAASPTVANGTGGRGAVARGQLAGAPAPSATQAVRLTARPRSGPKAARGPQQRREGFRVSTLRVRRPSARAAAARVVVARGSKEAHAGAPKAPASDAVAGAPAHAGY